MQEESKRNAILIDGFTKDFIDKREVPHREMTNAHANFRKMIEHRLSADSDIKNIIGDNTWIKDLIVNNALFRAHFSGAFHEMELSKRKTTKIDKKQPMNWGGF